MKIRKIVAALLATAMVLTSSGFSQVAYASEMTEGDVAVSEEASNVEDAGNVETVNEDTSYDSEGGQEIETSDEDTSEASSDVAQDEDSDGEYSDEFSDDEVLEDELLEDELALDEQLIDEEEELEEEEEIEYDEDGYVIHAADDYFVRTGGELKLKDGAVLASVIRIPWDTTSIPAGIFKSNSMVKKILIEEKHGGDMKAPKLTTIADEAFAYSKVEEIELPANVSIGEGAFRYSKLKKINFIKADDNSHASATSTATEIKPNTFQSTQVVNVEFPLCTKVGDSAFADCKSLTSVKMPKVKTIESAAFYGCTYLGEKNFFREKPDLEEIGNDAFAYCGFSSIDLEYNTKLKSLVKREGGVPTGNPTGEYDSANSKLGLSAFSYNKNLTYIMFAAGEATNIDYIPGGICEGCTNLSSIVIPKNAAVIGDSAFEECTALKEIDLQGVNFVKSKAFANCYNLNTITMRYNGDGNVVIYKDAFPDKDKVTVKGYHPEVEEYANNKSGYTFVSLYDKHTITVNTTGGAKVVLSASSAIPGQTITATVTTSNPLKEVYYSSNLTGSDEPEFVSSEVKGSNNVLTYTFKMPDTNLTFYAKALTAKELNDMELSVDFESDSIAPGTFIPDGSDRAYTWPRRGLSAKIKMMGTEQLPNWLFSFKSDSPDYVTVDANGVITGVSEGKTAKITATANWNKNKSIYFNITVKGDVKILKLENGAGWGDGGAKASDYISDASTPVSVSLDEVTGYPVIMFNKTDLSKKAATVTVGFEAFAGTDPGAYGTTLNRDKSYNVKATWTTSDAAVAKPKNTTSTFNENVINVLKGASGEAKIAISTLNKGETKVNQYNEKADGTYNPIEDNLTYVIIKVVDTTPRLGEKDITVNHQRISGTAITVVPVYGMEINDDVGLTVVEKRTVNGQADYYVSKDADQFRVTYDDFDGLYYISTKDSVSIAKGKKSAYKNKFYLKGTYKNGIEGDFYIPVPNLTLVNESLSPKLTQTGSINIFYNYDASEEEKGSVTVTQSLKDYPVDKYELVSATNYKKPSTEISDKEHGEIYTMTKTDMATETSGPVPFDSFWYNFDLNFAKGGDPAADPSLRPDINNQVVITMSPETVGDAGYAKVSNKAVVSGYLAIYFHDYKEPAYVPLTVKTVNTAPSYLLSETSATVAKQATAQDHEWELYLYPKGKANIPGNAVDFAIERSDDGTVTKSKVYNDDVTEYYVNFDQNSTKASFPESCLKTKGKLDNNRFYLKIDKGSPIIAGKARIALHMRTWADKNKYLYYDFTLNTTDKVTASFKDNVSSAEVNKAFISTFSDSEDDPEVREFSQELTVVSSLPKDVDVKKVMITDDFRNTKNPASVDSYTAVKKLIGIVDGTPIIYIRQPRETELASIPTGTYTFTCTPYFSYKGTSVEFEGNKLSFRVTVTQKAPTVTLGKITLNTAKTNYRQGGVAVNEVQTVSCKYGNIPKNMLPLEFELGYETGATFKHASKPENAGTKPGSFKNPKEKSDFEADVAQITHPSSKDGGGYAYATKGTTPANFVKSIGKYTVNGAYLECTGSALKAAIPNYAIEVAQNTVVPSITLSASGTMNLIIPESGITYTTKLNNIAGAIRSEVGVMELDGDSKKYVPSRFKAEYDPDTGKTFVSVRDDWDGTGDANNPDTKWNASEIKANTAYQIYLFYGVSSMSHYTGAAPIRTGEEAGYDIMATATITPVESFPKLTVTARKPYSFAGQNRKQGYGPSAYTSGNMWDIQVTVKLENSFWLKTDKNKNGIYEPWLGDKLTQTNVSGVDWGNAVAKVYADQFTILAASTFDYDPETGVLTYAVRLKNASEQVQNKSYNLVMAPTFVERQKRKPVKSSTTYTVKVDVNK